MVIDFFRIILNQIILHYFLQYIFFFDKYDFLQYIRYSSFLPNQIYMEIQVPSKVKVFTWLVAYKRVNTNDTI